MLSQGSRIRLLLLALLAAGACATRPIPLPPAEPAGEIAAQTVRRLEALSLYPDRIDRRMLVGALEALEAAYDPVRFEPQEQVGTLHVGLRGVSVPLDQRLDPEAFRATLGAALAFVKTELGPELSDKQREEIEVLALRGALAAMDRYATIISGRGTEDFRIRFSGKLHGIGSRVGRRDGDLVAIRVFPDSPAERGGLRDGDAILAVDGTSTRPLTVGEAVGQIRGKIGTRVVLGIQREERQLEVEITRGEVTVPSVETKSLGDQLGYARIFQVSRTTLAEFREKVLALGPIDGLVLDLRGNSGGSMLAAAGIADLFLSGDTIVRVVGRSGRSPRQLRKRTRATSSVLFEFPVVVLVDPGTASAAEILSGAIQPLDRVTVIGETTFGKGLIQRVVPLVDERLIKLTVAEYRLSNNRVIHERGVVPDVTLYPVSSERLSPLARVPEGAIPYVRSTGTEDDFPIEAAAAVLLHGLAAGTREISERSTAIVAESLGALDINWDPDDASYAEQLPEPLEIIAAEVGLTGGERSEILLEIRNPNPFPIASTWVALDSPIPFLSGGLTAVGTLPAGGSALARFEVEPPEGLSAEELEVRALVASGAHALHEETLTLSFRNRPVHLEIAIERRSDPGSEDESIAVTVTNLDPRDSGSLRIDVPGAFRTLEGLEAHASESFELPLSGEVSFVAITLLGPGVWRQIQVPLPETRTTIRPPDLEVTTVRRFGGEEIQLIARAEDGLREGWIRLDGEKERYERFNGARAASLKIALPHGSHEVSAWVETGDGVAILDARTLYGN